MMVSRDDPRFQRRLERVAKSRVAVLEYADSTDCNEGDLPCPLCQEGKMHFKRRDNGHLVVSCNTPKCLSWFDISLSGSTCDWSTGGRDTYLLTATHQNGRPVQQEVPA